MNLNQNISFTSYHQEEKLQKYLQKIKNKSFFNAGIRNNIKKSEKKPNAKNTVCSHLSNFKNQTIHMNQALFLRSVLLVEVKNACLNDDFRWLLNSMVGNKKLDFFFSTVNPYLHKHVLTLGTGFYV